MKTVPWTLQDYGLHCTCWYLAGGMYMRISGIDYEKGLIAFSGFEFVPVSKLKDFHYFPNDKSMEGATPCTKEVQE